VLRGVFGLWDADGCTLLLFRVRAGGAFSRAVVV
jgi:hypothetical protein